MPEQNQSTAIIENSKAHKTKHRDNAPNGISLYSMNAIASVQLNTASGCYSFNLTSSTSRFLESSINYSNLPPEHGLENWLDRNIKQHLENELVRGSIMCRVHFYPQEQSETTLPTFNLPLFKELCQRCASLKDELAQQDLGNVPLNINLSELLQYPEMVQQADTNPDTHGHSICQQELTQALDELISRFLANSLQQGNKLKKEIVHTIAKIETLLSEIKQELPQQRKYEYERLKATIAELNLPLNEEALNNELTNNLQKLDIAEETDRIAIHCQAIRSLLCVPVPSHPSKAAATDLTPTNEASPAALLAQQFTQVEHLIATPAPGMFDVINSKAATPQDEDHPQDEVYLQDEAHSDNATDDSTSTPNDSASATDDSTSTTDESTSATHDRATPALWGKKIDFLAQELSREANTMCAKSHVLTILYRAIEIKAAIEHLREIARLVV